jgi:DNA invertase Pin-like site-specific DNA recombinase
VRKMKADGMSITGIAGALGIARISVYRALGRVT